MPEKMAVVDYEKCRPEQCDKGICAAAKICPQKILRQEAPYEVPSGYSSICKGCAKCVPACPLRAIKVE